MVIKSEPTCENELRILVVGLQNECEFHTQWKINLLSKGTRCSFKFTQDRLEYLTYLCSFKPALIVIDQFTPYFSAYDIVNTTRQLGVHLPIVGLLGPSISRKAWANIGIDLVADRKGGPQIESILGRINKTRKCTSTLASNQRLLVKIQENIDGLGRIKDFLLGGINPNDELARGITTEIDHSIHYLRQLKANISL